jgi:integrase
MTEVESKLSWLDTFSSNSSKITYRSALKVFFKFIYPGEIEALEEKKNKKFIRQPELAIFAERYLSENRNYKRDIESFFADLQKDKAPISITNLLGTVRVFLSENGVEMTPLTFWRTLKKRQKVKGTVVDDRLPTQAELKTIIGFQKIQGHALFLFLSSSGTRIGETLQLKWSDLDLTSTPARVNIRAETSKTGYKRIAFISTEASQVLNDWKKINNEERVFPIAVSVASQMWASAVNKAGLMEKSHGRLRLHIHVLRKRFRTKLGAVTPTIPNDVIEVLMGHHGGPLDDAYRKYNSEEGAKTLAQFYLQGEPTLSVMGNQEEITKLIEEQTKINKLSQEKPEIAKLLSRNRTLESKISNLEEKLSYVTEKIDEFSETISKLETH